MGHGDYKSPALSCNFQNSKDQTKNLANTSNRGFSAGNLPDSAVIEFQTHYQKRFGVLLTLIEARKLAVYLLDLYRFTAEETHD